MTNHEPTGFFVVLVDGEPDVGEVLRARPNAIKDKDGIDYNTTGFQWFIDGDMIPGATKQTYTPTKSDRGKRLSVKWSYIDKMGTHESVENKPIHGFVTEPRMENLRGLYVELFGRDPDGAGLVFWADVLSSYYVDGIDRLEALQKVMGQFVAGATPEDKAAYKGLQNHLNK